MTLKRTIRLINIGVTLIGIGAAAAIYLKEYVEKQEEQKEQKREEAATDEKREPLRLTPQGRVITEDVHNAIDAIITENEERVRKEKLDNKAADKVREGAVPSESAKKPKKPKKDVPVERPSDEALLELVNTGTIDDLVALEQLGKTVSERIIAARPIKKLEDLQSIPYCPYYISKKK